MGMTGSWETASQWIVSYHIDPMSLMQAAGWGAELTSIFLASVIRRVGWSIKPAPIKYTGCKDAANPKYRKQAAAAEAQHPRACATGEAVHATRVTPTCCN